MIDHLLRLDGDGRNRRNAKCLDERRFLSEGELANKHKRDLHYSQESKILSLKENPWRVEKEEATQNRLRVLIIDIGKLSGGPAVFLLDLGNVLVTEVSNCREVDGKE